MKTLLSILVFIFVLIQTSHGQSSDPAWKIVQRPEKKQIDILLGSRLVTSYCYYDSIRKPILFPVNSLSGITVTRGYPILPLAGETADHPHHMGLWLNYEYVNGYDFWNNSTAIKLSERGKYGTIRHDHVITAKASGSGANLSVAADWIIPDKSVLLKEETRFFFQAKGEKLIIDRITKLTAQDKEVSFKDTKDGLIAIRVARELEQPIRGEREIVATDGKVVNVQDTGEPATGLYLNSEGLTGDAAWGARARWCSIAGKKNNQDVSISIIDHPKNTGYPTYWHARGYGLFAANPLGQEIFSKGKEILNFRLPAHQSVEFRFRIVVASGKKLTAADINILADEFARSF